MDLVQGQRPVMTSGPAEAEAGASIATGTVLRAQQESIESLRELARLARHVIAADQDRSAPDFAPAFDAECIGCGIRISGAELLQIGDVTGGDAAADSKVDRLRKGYCARRTCESRFYEIRCIARSGIDWQAILAMKDGYVSAPQTFAADDDAFASPSLRKKLILAGGIGIAGVLLLAIAFQYWTGGRIPFLREPEKFEVDPGAAQWYNDIKEAAAAEN